MEHVGLKMTHVQNFSSMQFLNQVKCDTTSAINQWLVTAVGGGGKGGLEDTINFIPSPTRLFNVLMISPAPPHWQLIGSEFALIPLYALLATTDPSVPPENYVTP